MTYAPLKSFKQNASAYFILGLAIVQLTYLSPIVPAYFSFIQIWQVETLSTLLLLSSLLYLILSREWKRPVVGIENARYLVIPLVAFSIWSFVSISWAPSWRSALHHSLLWCSYIFFYLILRQIVGSEKGYRVLLSVLTLVFVLHSIPAVIEYAGFLVLGGSTTLGVRFAKYGEPIVTLLPLILVGVVRSAGRRFLFGTASIVLLWLLIFCSFGRVNIALFVGGFLATAVAIFSIQRFRQYRTKVIIVAAACAFVLLPLNAPTLISSGVSELPIAQRLGDQAGISGSNGFRRLMISLSLEMFRANPVGGVGADNFGTEVNTYRKIYAEKYPDDANLTHAENEIPERAHNEYLHVLSELGIVGLGLFAWFFAGILYLFWRSRRPLPLRSIAAFVGIGCFLASSLVSSYSFRFVQNGIVFFFVLAVLSKLSTDRRSTTREVDLRVFRVVCAAGIVICLLLFTYHIPRAVAAYQISRAAAVPYEEAQAKLALARMLDPENPSAYSVEGMMLFDRRDFSHASFFLERSIQLGRSTSVDFSYLASAQYLGSDLPGAERSLKEAVAMYPYSVFLRVRLAAIQNSLGKVAEADEQMEIARTINPKHAQTWQNFIEKGAEYASQRSFADGLPGVMDLYPRNAIYAIQAEREIRNPGEKSKIDFGGSQ